MIIRDMAELAEILSEYERPTSVGEYSLATIRQLMEYLGNPQDSLRVIHIAGTSGKTSTSYFTASLLHQAGYSVGLSVSPHIDTVRERTQIDMGLIDEAEYLDLFGMFMEKVLQSKLVPSYFELMVAFSYWTFAKKEVDFAVVEVGLGGLLDGTNIVTRPDKVCVITDIGYDHMNILGDTIEEIARQKAGIILDENVVYMHHQDRAIERVIQEVAQSKNAVIEFANEADDEALEKLPLFQRRNFSLAFAAVSSVADISSDALVAAADVYIPARMEKVIVGNKTVILDGAHNEQKIRTLVLSLKQQYPDTRMTVVTAFNGNRHESMEEGIAILKDIADVVIATGFESHQDVMHQSLDPKEIVNEAEKLGIEKVHRIDSPAEAMRHALMLGNPITLVVGSFYLLQYVRAVIK